METTSTEQNQSLNQQDSIKATRILSERLGMTYDSVSDSDTPLVCTQENIYLKYGRYENYCCTIDFKQDSGTFKKYGASVCGKFKYSLKQRNLLEENICQAPMKETKGNIQFDIIMGRDEFSDDLLTEIDRDGFPIEDIEAILCFRSDTSRPFSQTGKKEIKNCLPVEIDWTVRELLQVQLGFYGSLMEKGYHLLPFQIVELVSLIQYLEPENVNGWVKDISEDPKWKSTIRHQYLILKKEDCGLTYDEKAELQYLKLIRAKRRYQILEKQLNETCLDLKSQPDDIKVLYFNFVMEFEPRIIVMDNPRIWIDFERACHIVVRHVDGMQAKGRFESNKTLFQYGFKELFNLIGVVVNIVLDDIRDTWNSNPNKNFGRRGNRAIEYNGNYYCIEIESNGRVMAFYPLN